MSITKAKLEEFIGKNVTISLFDGSEYTGNLRKTGTEELRNRNITLFYTKNRYFIERNGTMSPCFRVSHITRIKLVNK